MPKRSTHTFEAEKDGVKEDPLAIQFCMCCGESVLILGPEAALADLPRRRTDGAIVLEKGKVTFRLKSKPRETKVLKRAAGFERQYRFGCWNCGVTLGYRTEEGDGAALTYLLPNVIGQQADLYLQMYQVPQCIQSTGPNSVRIALEVRAGQSKRALLAVDPEAVLLSVTSPPKEGLANAELVDFLQKVLLVPRSQLQLSRGWSLSSNFLIVSGLQPAVIFKRLKGAIAAEAPVGVSMREAADAAAGPTAGPATTNPSTGEQVFTAGAATFIARKAWERAEVEDDDLAEAPTIQQQSFIK